MTSLYFSLLARKVAKEHTAIQERSSLSALLPPERLFVLDHGDLFIYFRFAKIMQIKYFALTPHQEQGRLPKGKSVPPAFWCEGAFLLRTFLF
ncbi:hypothetical protein [Sulfuricurvum sp.]|uniref:hypothetical protein n=1 Tax=Sulfuricurvum sp. TaxID=2025608 RepID=UPI003BB4DD1E